MQDHGSEKKHFVLKAIPQRPTFQQDMTEDERNIMQQHIAYWTDKMDKGITLVFGPVFNPQDPHGLGIIEVTDESQVNDLITNDPAVLSGLQRTEYYPMRAILPSKKL